MKKILPIFLLISPLLSACTSTFPALLLTEKLRTVLIDPATNNELIISNQPLLLFGIGMHIEPQGESHQGYRSGKGDFKRPEYFDLQAENIRAVAQIIQKHGGKMTVQAQSPFTDVVIENDDPILKDLAAAGNEIGLHFHEDAHLGKKPESLPVNRWCAVMKEEIRLVKQASGVSSLRYWSGGNLYPDVFEAAECAGLDINSDWKNPQTQSTDLSLTGIHPWRPADGSDGSSFDLLSEHDPDGPAIFLPEGLFDTDNFTSMRRSEEAGSDQAYFEYLAQSLRASLEAAESGKVNVFHFTLHPGEFRGQPAHPFEVIESFLTNVVDPLVTSGRVRWATYSEMADDFSAWEQANPEQDMRD